MATFRSFFGFTAGAAAGAYTLTADAGAVVVTFNDAALIRTHAPMAAAQGAIVVTGIDATLKYHRVYAMLAETGSLVVTGYPAALSTLANKVMLAAASTINVTGFDADLVYDYAARVLAAEPAAIVITGNSADYRLVLAPRFEVWNFGRSKEELRKVFRW